MGAYLKPEGRLLIAIENRLGLKYFAGAPEDHTDLHFFGINGYPGNQSQRTFSKNELGELLENSGFPFLRFTTRIRIINFRQRFLQMRVFIPIPTEEAILYTQIRQQIFLQKVKA